jgi:hypothetical protein
VRVTLLTLFAFVAGAATALSPCVLPVLPVALAAGATSRRRPPLGVVTGLVLSFTFATVALANARTRLRPVVVAGRYAYRVPIGARVRQGAQGAARRARARRRGRAAPARPLRPADRVTKTSELAHLFRSLKAPTAARALPKHSVAVANATLWPASQARIEKPHV